MQSGTIDLRAADGWIAFIIKRRPVAWLSIAMDTPTGLKGKTWGDQAPARAKMASSTFLVHQAGGDVIPDHGGRPAWPYRVVSRCRREVSALQESTWLRRWKPVLTYHAKHGKWPHRDSELGEEMHNLMRRAIRLRLTEISPAIGAALLHQNGSGNRLTEWWKKMHRVQHIVTQHDIHEDCKGQPHVTPVLIETCVALCGSGRESERLCRRA